MPTPAEHYAEAERLLEAFRAEQVSTGNAQAHKAPLTFALAQVHATLATVDVDGLWPKQWVNPPVAQGRVADAGGGEIRIVVDRTTVHYPEIDDEVSVFTRIVQDR